MVIFIKKNDEGIFVQMMPKKGERLNLKNWVLKGLLLK